MKKRLSQTLVAILVVASLQFTYAAESNEPSALVELQALIAKIQETLKAGKTQEADMAVGIKNLDALNAKYKSSNKEAAAGAILIKAQIYLQVLENSSKAEELLAQVVKDYTGTEAAKMAERLQDQVKAAAAVKNIQNALSIGSVFPDFDEKDLMGNPLSVAHYKGKVVLVDFWATWCGPCRMELPNVIAAYEKYHSKGFEIVGISLDADRAKLENFIKANKMTWAQYFDGLGWGNKLSNKYGVRSIPATFLIDREGKIIAKDLRGDELVAAVEKALAAK